MSLVLKTFITARDCRDRLLGFMYIDQQQEISIFICFGNQIKTPELSAEVRSRAENVTVMTVFTQETLWSE